MRRLASTESPGIRRFRDELGTWIARFETDKSEAALDFWYRVHKGTHEVLGEF